MTELTFLSAKTLAGMIRDGEASSEEVVRAHLERIDATNPAINAVVVVLADAALAEARRPAPRRARHREGRHRDRGRRHHRRHARQGRVRARPRRHRREQA